MLRYPTPSCRRAVSVPTNRATSILGAAMLGAACLAASAPAGAAEVRSESAGSRSGTLVLSGIIEAGDDAKVTAALAREPRPTTLVLSSLGGNVQAALAIGTLVRRDGLRTAVATRAVCASACGLVWLAGTSRTLGQDGHVGLHAAYLRRNGVSVETGAANALIGAYLARLGLDDRAIVYLTSAAPDEMTWIIPADRQRYGIAFDAAAAPTVAATTPDTTDQHFLARPMALAGAIASAAMAAIDRLVGGHPAPAPDR